MNKLKKLLLYEILDYVPQLTISQYKDIKNKKFFAYYLKRKREDTIVKRKKITRENLIKQKEEETRRRIEQERNERQRIENRNRINNQGNMQIIRMLIFRSAIIDNSSINHTKGINSDSFEDDLAKVKSLVKLNTSDIINIRHTTKEINGAFLPELVYNSDSKIQITKKELIRIIKL